MMPRLLYIRKGINCCKLGVKGNIFSLFLLYNREKGEFYMKLYDKKMVLRKIANLFEYYRECDKEEERAFKSTFFIISKTPLKSTE